MTSLLFSSLPLATNILENLETLGYEQMTPVQAKSLPYLLNNKDVIAKAKTGSGKTAAFGIGLLSKIDPSLFEPQACVICPTRELADQLCKEIRRLARLIPNIRVLTLCGGKPTRTQIESLQKGAHIVVGTPGRLQDHINKNTLQLNRIDTLVLDEADRMLDMGFYDEIIAIIKHMPKTRQTLLFSATYPPSIQKISHLIQNKPIEIICDVEEDAPNIEQIAYQTQSSEKSGALVSLLKHYQLPSAIIFCNTKIQCDELVVDLQKKGTDALALHGDLEQKDREEVLLQFANNSCALLVATDVAARGLDIKNLPAVINFDLPNDPEQYIHRIGRTGRNGQSGLAINLLASHERGKLELFEAISQSTIEHVLPTSLKNKSELIAKPSMHTLFLNCGKKSKIRPGDILGVLTGSGGLSGDDVGKIDIFDFCAYVAVKRNRSSFVLNNLKGVKIKGHPFKIRYCNNPSYSGATHEND